MKRFLILVNSSYCRDGQIIDLECASFEKSGELIEGTEDFRDFFGDFSLGEFLAESGEEAMDIVSSRYVMPKNTLKYYEIMN